MRGASSTSTHDTFLLAVSPQEQRHWLPNDIPVIVVALSTHVFDQDIQTPQDKLTLLTLQLQLVKAGHNCTSSLFPSPANFYALLHMTMAVLQGNIWAV